MGLSGVSGPFRGAYCILQAHKDTVATGQTDLEIFEWTVPAGMDIVIVQVQAYCDAAGAAAATVDVEDDATSVLTGNITLSADAVVAGTLSTSTGVEVAAGSALTVDVTTGSTTAPDDISVTIVFYPTTHPDSVRSAFE